MFCVLLSLDDSLLFSSSSDQTILVWNRSKSQKKAELTGHTGSVYTLKLSKNPKFIYSGSYDNFIIKWNVETFKIEEKFKGFYTYLNSMVLSSSEDIIYCLLYTSPSPRDLSTSRMPSSA